MHKIVWWDIFRYFCCIYAFRSRMVPRRTKKNLFLKVFLSLEIFYFNSRPKFSLFVNIVFLNF